MCLAVTGAIGDNAMDHEQVAAFAGDFLLERYPQQLVERYKLKTVPENGAFLIEEVGRRRGCLAPGGVVDRQRAAELLLNDLQGGRLGRISMETQSDIVEE
jgi:ribosome biogenesis GTPase A